MYIFLCFVEFQVETGENLRGKNQPDACFMAMNSQVSYSHTQQIFKELKDC